MNTTQIRELLQKRKLKVTPTRLNLLSEMDKYGSAMSHSTIQNQLNPIDRGFLTPFNPNARYKNQK